MARPAAATTPTTAPAGDTRSPLRRIAAQYAESRIAMLALATLSAVAVIAVTAPLIAPQNPYDLRAIDIEDGRLPPGSAKLSRPADVGMTVTIRDRLTGDRPGYDVKARGRAGDAPRRSARTAARRGAGRHRRPALPDDPRPGACRSARSPAQRAASGAAARH